jgi:glycogen synthase
MDVVNNTGNGFLFKNHDAKGLLWAISEAMSFFNLPHEIKAKQIERVMTECSAGFSPEIMTSQYIQLYEKMLERPLVTE